MRSLILILVIHAITAYSDFKPVCPSADLLKPCQCHSGGDIPPIVYCSGNSSLDLSPVMQRLSDSNDNQDKYILNLFINNTAITEMKANTFKNIGVGSLYLHNVTSLTKIDENAFYGNIKDTLRDIYIRGAPSLQNKNNSFYKAINKLSSLVFLEIRDTNITEVPDNAFGDNLKQLKTIQISGQSFRSIGRNVFEGLDSIEDVSLMDTDISYIPDEAFVNREDNDFFYLALSGNHKLTQTGFGPHSMSNIVHNGSTQSTVVLSFPYQPTNDLTYLNETVFRPFLETNRNNRLMINEHTFNCSDPRNHWVLVSNLFLFQVHHARCQTKNDNFEHDELKWKFFKIKYQKTYSDSKQEDYRKSIFLNKLETIRNHNQQYESGLKTYRMAVNKYTDLKKEELFMKRSDLINVDRLTLFKNYQTIENNRSLPKTVDWRTKNAVTGVRDQQVSKCGSCWAHAAAASIEGHLAIKTGKLVELSPQSLVDCGWEQGSFGCRGGLSEYAYDSVVDNGGIATEQSYPYRATNQDCLLDNSTIGATIRDYVLIPKGDEEELKKVVALIGPVSVGVDSTGYGFDGYSSGVYSDDLCGDNGDDSIHEMTIVGYGTTDDGQDYWLIKNSFGSDWGDNGYMKWARNKNNMCGIASEASYPIGVEQGHS